MSWLPIAPKLVFRFSCRPITVRDSRQDPIRLHNLLEAQDVMAGSGMRRSQAGAVLDPARRLLEDSDFWRNIGSGLAVFAAPEYFRAVRLPLAMPAKVAMGSHFVVQPLLPLLADGGTFFVLAISAKSVRVLHCTQVASPAKSRCPI